MAGHHTHGVPWSTRRMASWRKAGALWSTHQQVAQEASDVRDEGSIMLDDRVRDDDTMAKVEVWRVSRRVLRQTPTQVVRLTRWRQGCPWRRRRQRLGDVDIRPQLDSSTTFGRWRQKINWKMSAVWSRHGAATLTWRYHLRTGRR